MWKLVSGISLALCLFAVADETDPETCVSVQCCGRLRHGVVAIGGETTGTTITFNRIVWELRLDDDAERDFAEAHHKKSVVVTGRLRKVSGIETKDRWIIDVKKLSEPDASTDTEGAQLRIRGKLGATKPSVVGAPEMTIESDGQVWPINLSEDASLKVRAESLVGQPVLVKGSLKHGNPGAADPDETETPGVIQITTVTRMTETCVPDQQPVP